MPSVRVHYTVLLLLLILYEHVVATAGFSLRCPDDEKPNSEHHEVIKRNLNSTLPGDVKSNTESSGATVEQLKNGIIDSKPVDKTAPPNTAQDRAMFGSNIYDDMLAKDVDEALIDQIFSSDDLSLEGDFEFGRNLNNTKRSLEQSLKDSFNDESQNGCFSNLANPCDDSLVNSMNYDGTQSPMSDRVERFKRTATQATPEDSTEKSSIKKEIEKVYNDISENVRLLWKLREMECSSLKQPLNKRFIIYDQSDDQMDKTDGKRNVEDLTIEQQNKRDVAPEKVEHIERKTDEEILQVNVPLKPKK